MVKGGDESNEEHSIVQQQRKRKRNSTPKGGGGGITIDAIWMDEITEIAVMYWAPYSENHKNFDANLINHLYTNELLGTMFSQRKIVMLEFSQYLEAYLWPNFDAINASTEHVLSIVAMVNEKFRERISAWKCFEKFPDNFPAFFNRVLHLSLDEDNLSMIEHTMIIAFLVNCFSSIEVDIIRTEVTRIVSLSIWSNLIPSQLEDLLNATPKFRKYWNHMIKSTTKYDDEKQQKMKFERELLWKLLHKFLKVLADIPIDGEIDLHSVHYCERFLELCIDLDALLTTRRFFNALLLGSNLITHCTLSALIRRDDGGLFCQLLQMLRFYVNFEIDDVSGRQLTQSEMTERHYAYVIDLQKAAFRHFRESMRDFYLLNVSAVDTRKALTKLFSAMKKEELYKFAEFLHLVPPLTADDGANELETYSDEFLSEMLISRCERRPNQMQQLNEMPLYPTEKVIWDENLVPYDKYTGEGVLALYKLNLQFLALHDYLLRNFTLFQMESTYEIRQDLEDVILRMKPWLHENGRDVVYGGWARMGITITAFQIVEVAKPNIGEKSPASVRADVSIHLDRRADIRREWEGLRKHDIGFLVTCRPTKPVGTRYDVRIPFKEQFEIAYVRGCEIEGMLDPQGNVIEEFAIDKKPLVSGDTRTYRVWLDTNQYRLDMERQATGAEDLYYTFNLFIRRNSKSNNFKAVLSTMRLLLNTDCVVPDWLHDLILGYGEPDSVHYSKMTNSIATVDFDDTFLSYDHLVASFPNYKVTNTIDNDELLVPPFRLTFKDLEPAHDIVDGVVVDKTIVVTPHIIPSRGPYPYSEPRRNSIRFTPAQVEAIKSGMQPGLTMVVGPPGTGKTDVAVQIISNIYHNWPEQRTLIVTHSNQALNQIFQKIIALDVDERHLLRLGHGEEELETEKDFSRYGRVNYVLAKRLDLLKQVERLQQSLGVIGDVAYTCETAGHFYLYQVYARWEEFEQKIKQLQTQSSTVDIVAKHFPFTKFFDDAPPPLFKNVSFDEDLAIAQGCWRHIRRIFDELHEFRAFELLRSGRDRTEYLLVKEAKIIAMTCTHAALRRKDLCELGFRYDNVLMEEAAQILEVETFIPLLLQNPQDGRSRLKRWIMIGDHHQLPPIVQNMAFQKYSNMEQSMFARFVRLGVPTVLLDAQGRARPTIAELYNWRYRSLGNLPHIASMIEYQQANAGFVLDYQLVDVTDFDGVGETTPSPYFYQNLGEAEYAVAIFMYMRILGYPADKITLLTTYNGQAGLLRDVIERRCAANPIFGRPHKISTVDKYQGQQNDYIILSLVRTKAVGHIRDVRRLIVALSRARLSLIVLARVSLFRNCFELTPAFNKLCERSLKLLIVPNETYPTSRLLTEKPPMTPIEIQDTKHMARFVEEFYRSNIDQLQKTYHEQMKEYIAVQKEALTAELSQRPIDVRTVEKSIAAAEKDEDEREKEIAFEPIVAESSDEV